MSTSRWYGTFVAFLAFWLMYGLFSLLGGRFDLVSALVFAMSSVVLGLLVDRARRRRARDGSGVSGATRRR